MTYFCDEMVVYGQKISFRRMMFGLGRFIRVVEGVGRKVFI